MLRSRDMLPGDEDRVDSDVSSELHAGSTEEDRLVAQRLQVVRRIGLEGADDRTVRKAHELADLKEVVTVEDLRSLGARARHKRTGTAAVSLLPTTGARNGHSSIRLQNRAKRMRRQAASARRQRPRMAGVSSSDDGIHIKTRTKVDVDPSSAAQPTDQSQSYHSCQYMYDDLAYDVFDAAWEVRHGALVGLRSLLSDFCHRQRHVLSALSDEATTTDDSACLHDAALRCMCVLALDHFGDYGGDTVVAPVREVAAHVLAVVVQHVPLSHVRFVVTTLLRVHNSKNWNVRHGTALGLKFVLGVRSDLGASLLGEAVPAVLPMLADESDDVRVVAAETLLVIVQRSDVDCVPIEVRGAPARGGTQRLIRATWLALLEAADLEASSAAVLHLLAELTDRLLELKDYSLRPASMVVLFPALWPHLQNSVASVRASAARTIGRLLQVADRVELERDVLGKHPTSTVPHALAELVEERRASTSATASPNWLAAHISQLLNVLFVRIIIEDDRTVLTELWSAWQVAISESMISAEAVDAAVEPHCILWLEILSTADGNPIDSDVLPQTHWIRISRTADVSGEEIEERRLSVSPRTALMDCKRRLRGSRAIATALSRCSTGKDSDWVSTNLANMLMTDRRATAWESISHVVANLAIACVGSRAPPPIDAIKCVQSLLSDSRFAKGDFIEVQSLVESVRDVCVRLVRNLRAAKLNVEMQGDASEISLEDASALATTLLPEWMSSLPSRGAQAHERAALAEALSRQLRLCDKELLRAKVRVQAAAAAAVARHSTLPPKLNPLMHAFMNSVKVEKDPDAQQAATVAFAYLLRRCCSEGRNRAASVAFGNLCRFVATSVVAGDDAIENDRIRLRGAELTIAEVVQAFGPRTLELAPELFDYVGDSLSRRGAAHREDGEPGTMLGTTTGGLAVLRILASINEASLEAEVLQYLPVAFDASRGADVLCDEEGARAVCAVVRMNMGTSLEQLVQQMLPKSLASDDYRYQRRGLQVLRALIAELGTELLPCTAIFVSMVVPLLSHHEESVRTIAAQTFSLLVTAVPLDLGMVEPPAWARSEALRGARDKGLVIVRGILDGAATQAAGEVALPRNIDFRPYQREGVAWLSFLRDHGLHGILADEMGLGKTVSALSVMLSRSEVKHAPSLVVCPATIVEHWVQEVQRYFGDRAVALAYTGNAVRRRRGREVFADHDIVVCSYSILRTDGEALSQLHWHYVVLDEGHLIQNPATGVARAAKRLVARHRLILTGTPIQNDVLDLWSMFDFLLPGYLGDHAVFQRDVSRVVMRSRSKRCSSAEYLASERALSTLHRQVLPFILRRMKGDVLKDLPPKIIQDVTCELTPKQLELYQAFRKSAAWNTILRLASGPAKPEKRPLAKRPRPNRGASTGDRSGAPDDAATESRGVLACLHYLRQVCNHPALVSKSAEARSGQKRRRRREGDSSVCYDLESSCKLLGLQQLLQQLGIGSSNDDIPGLQGSDEVVAVDDSIDENASARPARNYNSTVDGGDDPTVAKVARLSAAVVAHRALVFSQLPSMLDAIEDGLLKPHMPCVRYCRIDGNVPAKDRTRLAEKFNSDGNIDLALLTTGIGGLGLTLTGADTVIFIDHDWNPMRDLQAMDRAHRLGQRKTVHVFRLLAKDTLEEKIMNHQRFKVRVAETVVTQDNARLSSTASGGLLDVLEAATREELTPVPPGSGGVTRSDVLVSASASAALSAHGAASIARQALEDMDEVWSEVRKEERELNSLLDWLQSIEE